MTTATVTKRLRAEGFPVELVRGDGYHYFVFDDGETVETESVYIPRFRSWSVDRWTEEGRTFAAKVAERIAERADAEPWKPGDVLKLGNRY